MALFELETSIHPDVNETHKYLEVLHNFPSVKLTLEQPVHKSLFTPAPEWSAKDEGALDCRGAEDRMC